MKVGDLIKFKSPTKSSRLYARWKIGLLLKYTLHEDKWDILCGDGIFRIRHGQIKQLERKNEAG